MPKDCELAIAMGYPPREHREQLARPRSVPCDPRAPPTPQQLERRRRVIVEAEDFAAKYRKQVVQKRQEFFEAERRFITDYLDKINS